jgi:hypothetical protein
MEFAPYPAQVLGQAQYENLPSSFNMSNMSSTLPDYQARGYGRQPHQQLLSSSPSNNLVYQMQQRPQFAGQNAPMFNPTTQQQYAMPSQQSQQPGRTTAMPFAHFGSSDEFSQQSNQQSRYPQQSQQYYQQPVSDSFGHSYAMRGGAVFPMGQMHLDSNLNASMAFSAHQGVPRSKTFV